MFVSRFLPVTRVHTVGYFDPQGQLHSVSDHATQNDAFDMVHFLNGGHAGKYAKEANERAFFGESSAQSDKVTAAADELVDISKDFTDDDDDDDAQEDGE